jgi:hypothetical protein
MKTKRFNKKLVLNKKTITNLDVKRMKSVNGGFTGLELCSQRPLLCDTAQCQITVDDTCDCTEHATCGEFTCKPQFTVC